MASPEPDGPVARGLSALNIEFLQRWVIKCSVRTQALKRHLVYLATQCLPALQIKFLQKWVVTLPVCSQGRPLVYHVAWGLSALSISFLQRWIVFCVHGGQATVNFVAQGLLHFTLSSWELSGQIWS
jgi:hypothetical protein